MVIAYDVKYIQVNLVRQREPDVAVGYNNMYNKTPKLTHRKADYHDHHYGAADFQTLVP